MKFSLEIGPKTELDTLPALKDVYITFLPGGDYKETSKKAEELVKKGLKFPEDTAGRIMSTNVVSVSASWTIGKTLKFLRQKKELLTDDIYAVSYTHLTLPTKA